MPGLIEVNDTNPQGPIAFAAFGKTPAWHRLGTVFEQDMTPHQALVAAHLAKWNVRLAHSQAYEDVVLNAAEVELLGAEPVIERVVAQSKKFHTVRNNPITGKMEVLGDGRGEGYTVVQNEELVNLLDALIGGGARISAAGSLRGGTQVFFCLELPGDVWVGGFDQVKTFLTIMNGHDGSLAVKAVASPIRVVCANTQAAALDSALSTWSHRHTKGVTAAVAQAQRDLDLTFAYTAEIDAEFERMINEPFKLPELDVVLKQVFDDPTEPGLSQKAITTRENKINGARAIWLNAADSPTMKGIEGTRYGAYQAITEFIDHGWGKTADARALRSVDGAGVSLRDTAFELLRVPA